MPRTDVDRGPLLGVRRAPALVYFEAKIDPIATAEPDWLGGVILSSPLPIELTHRAGPFGTQRLDLPRSRRHSDGCIAILRCVAATMLSTPLERGWPRVRFRAAASTGGVL
jgi:hypothetical protein